MSDARVLLERNDGVQRSPASRSTTPSAGTRTTPAMREALGGHLDELAFDDAIKVVVLRGEGGVFSTGADMNNAYAWYGNGCRGDGRAASARASAAACSVDRKTFDFYHVFLGYPKVTVAEVSGYALGGGFELALMSDIAVVASRHRRSACPRRDSSGRRWARCTCSSTVLARCSRAACSSPATRSPPIELAHLGVFTEVVEPSTVEAARELVRREGVAHAGRRHRDGEGGVPPRRTAPGVPRRRGAELLRPCVRHEPVSSTKASSTS